MKIQLIRHNEIIKSWNNELPCVFIKPHAGLVKVVNQDPLPDEEPVTCYRFISHLLENVHDKKLDVMEVHYRIVVGAKVS